MFEEDLKTVEVSSSDPLRQKQKSDIAKMRESLLLCESDSNLARASINNITVLRIYHQMSRIIRYLDMMDKIEEKLYDSINCQLEKMNEENSSTWMTLLNIQERLQKNMVESMKLLQPYLDIAEFAQFQVASESSENVPTLEFDAPKREKLRNNAQSVLKVLTETESNAG